MATWEWQGLIFWNHHFSRLFNIFWPPVCWLLHETFSIVCNNVCNANNGQWIDGKDVILSLYVCPMLFLITARSLQCKWSITQSVDCNIKDLEFAQNYQWSWKKVSEITLNLSGNDAFLPILLCCPFASLVCAEGGDSNVSISLVAEEWRMVNQKK